MGMKVLFLLETLKFVQSRLSKVGPKHTTGKNSNSKERRQKKSGVCSRKPLQCEDNEAS